MRVLVFANVASIIDQLALLVDPDEAAIILEKATVSHKLFEIVGKVTVASVRAEHFFVNTITHSRLEV